MFVRSGVTIRDGVAVAIFGLALITGCSAGDDSPGSGAAGSGGASVGGAATGGAAPSSGGAAGSAGGAASGGVGGASGGLAGAGTGGSPIEPSGPVVHTSAGDVQGFVTGETNAFLGIPYGKPPTGELRFAPPSPPAPWNGVRAATTPGLLCPRTKNATTSFTVLPPQGEDCLNLSVHAWKTAAKAPVVVFIPTNANGEYDGAALVEAGGVIVVTVNYRAGALANLVHPALDSALGVPSGNMGLRDQQLALAWVKDNIAAFGGDPDNVTVLGQSCLHAFAAGSRGLARRFVMNSVSCVSNPTMPLNRSSVAWLGDKLVAKLCPGASDPVGCLRGVSPEALVTFRYLDTTEPGPDPFGQSFSPQMDGAVIQDYPKRLLAAGDFHTGEILAGANLEEATITRLDPEQTKQLKNSKIALGFYGIFTYVTQWAGIQSLYTPATDADSVRSFERLSTDTWFRCPIRAVARAAAGAGRHVFLYSLDLAPAAGGLELDYLFGQPVASPVLAAPPYDVAAPVPLEAELVRAMQGYVTNFAKKGDPNGEGLPAWPAYTTSTDQHMVLDTSVGVSTAFSRTHCDAWDAANASSSY